MEDRTIQLWSELGEPFILESAIQVYYFFIDAKGGIDRYHTLEKVSGMDERWLGQCYLLLGKYEEAKEHFLKAISLGYIVARVDLARVYALSGEFEDSEEEFSKINIDDYRRIDKVFYYRNLSTLHKMKGEYRKSLKFIEKSWKCVIGCEEYRFMAPMILSQLAEMNSMLNNNKKALLYLEKAEKICITEYIWNVKMYRATMNFDEGDYNLSMKIFGEIIEGSKFPVHRYLAHIYTSRFYLINNRPEKALVYLEKALILPYGVMSNSVEVIVRYTMAMIYCLLLKKHKAYENIKKSEVIARDQVDLSQVSLMKNYYNYRFGIQSKEKILSSACDLTRENKNYSDSTEYLRSKIHELEYKLSLEMDINEEAESIIEYIIDNNLYKQIGEEWIFLPLAKKYFFDRYSDMLFDANKEIIIKSIDEEYIMYDNKKISIPLNKSLELIVFMLLKKRVTLRSILLNVFQDSNPIKAKNYFHQIKHSLAKKIQIITIEYSKEEKVYFIETKYPISMDIQHILDKNQRIGGIFLPSSGSDWVLELNQRLSE